MRRAKIDGKMKIFRNKRRKRERTNREVIESEDPRLEHAYVKFPRKRLIPVTKKSDEHSVDTDLFKLHTLMKEGGHKDYIGVHNHPHIPSQMISGFPSASDLKHFFLSRKMNGTVIAQRDNHTGKLMGYTLLLKRKNFKKGKQINDEELNSYSGNLTKNHLTYNVKNSYEELKQLAKEKGLSLKFIPARGFYFNKSIGSYEKKGNEIGRNLENAVTSILIGFALIFLLTKISFTGAVINDYFSNVSFTNLFIIGGLYFSAVIFILFRMTNRKKKKLKSHYR